MDDLQNDFIDARLNVGEKGDSQLKASVKTKVSLSTITNLELKGIIPTQELIIDSLKKYIKENQPTKERSKK